MTTRKTKRPIAKRPAAVRSSDMVMPLGEVVRLRLAQRWVRECQAMLTEAGVPEWVMTGDCTVPGSAVTCRLKWFLARRKDVKPSETAGEWRMDEPLTATKKRHNTEVSERRAAGLTCNREAPGASLD